MEKSKKWYNAELNQKDAEKLHQHLYDINAHFETSGCFDLVHFEIELTPEESKKLSNWLNSNIYNNTITNQS